MNGIKSFTIYDEYVDLISLLSVEEQKDLWKKIIDYVFTGEEPTDLTENQNKVWRNLKRPIDISKKRSLVGSKGAEIKKANDKANKEANDIAKTEANDEANDKANGYANGIAQKMSMSMLYVNKKNNKKKRVIGEEGEEERKKILEEFEKLWEMYPNKKSKSIALQKYSLAREQGATYEDVRQGLEHYIKHCKDNNLEQKYIKHGSTWFGQKCWEDDYSENNTESLPEWFGKENKKQELTEESSNELEELLKNLEEKQ